MDTVRTDMTVADFADMYGRGDIVVNREYQRSDKVWPDAAKSFLIETLILGYPLPKLSMFQETDIKLRRTTKEIVDGQQRTVTISDFYHNRLRLSTKLQTERLRGRRYDDLDLPDKERFLTYSIPIDLFVAATSFDIRETFRRMNSYTIPLNAEEQRHARFQGPFKWFAYGVAAEFEETFVDIGTFNAKKLVRMQDTKLIAEIVHAIENGIETTSKTILDRLYSTYDETFDDEDRLQRRFASALTTVNEVAEILRGTVVAKPHMMYALILAAMHMKKAIPSLDAVYSFDRPARLARDDFQNAVEWIDELLDRDTVPRKDQALYDACTVKTNVRSERVIRFQWFCDALIGA